MLVDVFGLGATLAVPTESKLEVPIKYPPAKPDNPAINGNMTLAFFLLIGEPRNAQNSTSYRLGHRGKWT